MAEMIPKEQWCLEIRAGKDALQLSLDTPQQYARTLAFVRLLGLMLTDGTVKHTHGAAWQANVFSGHAIDNESILADIELLTGKRTSPSRQQFVWSITVPTSIARFYVALGYPIGSKTQQPAWLPEFILDQKCPLAVVREFLGGLFGGDGHTAVYNSATQGFGSIGFTQTRVEEREENLCDFLYDIAVLANRLGSFEFTVSEGCRYDGKVSIVLHLQIADMVRFADTIGFRYCCHKTQRLTAACSYLDKRANTLRQQWWIIERAKQLRQTGRMPDGQGSLSMKRALPMLYEELKAQEPIYNEHYSLPGYETVMSALNGKSKGSRSSFRRDKFPSVEQYLKEIGAWESFSCDDKKPFAHTHGVSCSATALPAINLRVIGIRPVGARPVYDLTVDQYHNFVAGRIVAHNCGCPKDEFPGKKAPKMKDGTSKRVCAAYRYRWLKHEVSGKGILPTLLENLIAARKKTRKIIAFNEGEIKLLKKVLGREAFTEENCEMWAERFKVYDETKEPIPALELLRAKIPKPSTIMTPVDLSEAEKAVLKERVETLESLNLVLDRRQNAYKVNANSMYGAMGVKRGYLPFLPGAMCVTYMGRTNILKVNRFIEDKKGGHVIYNDTDSAYCHFPNFANKTVKELWAYAKQIVAEVKALFPPPVNSTSSRQQGAAQQCWGKQCNSLVQTLWFGQDCL